MRAYGATLDNPDLVVACVVGDGEAETATLATSWHLNKFLTPFDMLMMNNLDRFRLVMDVIHRVPTLEERYATLSQRMDDERIAHRAYTREHGEDSPDVSGVLGLPFHAREVRVDTGDDNRAH